MYRETRVSTFQALFKKGHLMRFDFNYKYRGLRYEAFVGIGVKKTHFNASNACGFFQDASCFRLIQFSLFLGRDLNAK